MVFQFLKIFECATNKIDQLTFLFITDSDKLIGREVLNITLIPLVVSPKINPMFFLNVHNNVKLDMVTSFIHMRNQLICLTSWFLLR